MDAREIERAVLSSGLVSSCACLVSESNAGDGVLTAHVVLATSSGGLRSGSGDGSGATLLDDCARVALEVHASCHLPPATVPRRFVAWAAFPKTANGKLDRARGWRASARSEPAETRRAKIVAGNDGASRRGRLGARRSASTRARLCVSDDFGALGGNSVSSARRRAASPRAPRARGAANARRRRGFSKKRFA